jgi:hypothetical protein
MTGQTEVVITDNGINQWDEEWESGGYDLTTGVKDNTQTRVRNKNLIRVAPNTSYYPKNIPWILKYGKNGEYLGVYNNGAGGVYTTESTTYYVGFETGVAYGTTYKYDISFNSPSTDTDYHAYKGKTYTIQLGDTIYGGELDVITGELTVTHGEVDLGELSWGKASLNPNVFYSFIDNYRFSQNIQALCEGYQFSGTRNSTQGMSDGTYAFYYSSGQTLREFYIADSAKSSLTGAEFKTAMSGVQLVYELATPYTIQLTPQQIRLLKDTNHLSCNTGDLSIKYYPDNVLGQLKGDIEKGLNAYYDYQIKALWDKIGELQA